MGRVGKRATTESARSSTRRNGHPGRWLKSKSASNPQTTEADGSGAPKLTSVYLSFQSRQERALKLFRTLTAAGFIGAAAIGPALALDISGAGATFPYPIYAKWADAYKKETNIGL